MVFRADGPLLRPEELPRLGIISNPEKDYLSYFNRIEGKKVLCIGYSEAEIDAYVAKYAPASISVLTLWAGHPDAAVGKYPLHLGDITKRTPYEDNTFDSVLSLSLLEHVSDLDAALIEMRRITRPGGEVCAMFGPAWSSAYGHHAYVRQEPLLDFSLWQMPAFLHLLCTPQEVERWYQEQGHSLADAKAVIHWFHAAQGINRLPYDAYMKAFSTHMTLEQAEMMTLDVPRDLLDILRVRYGWTDFSTYGGKYLLRA